METIDIVKEKGDILFIKLTDSIVINNIELFEREVYSILSDKKFNIIVDISKSEFIISQGLGILIKLNKKCKDNGGKIVIMNPNDRLKRILKVVHMDKIIDVEFNEENAIKKML
ncbi:STAS domain-containing protein [Haliovirga abyssi]|uniref:Anti-sigma factor antagonist n=1 Tax=Haliovirga abyssi TaxID=2996794 RepID=A0AAU9D1V0_9FUSO|nr:STAS domain-containing protein [Haliovirga abyssi]BDU49976.1 hypothetical protein HLVA_05450 [Haliovirga abyssi]